MATYKEIKGINIDVVSTDPSNPIEGQVWFNSTSNVLKGLRPDLAGTWATGGNLNTRVAGNVAVGNSSNSLSFAGANPPGS